MIGTSAVHKEDIAKYYAETDQAYRNWSEVKDSRVPYALHVGYHPLGKELDQFNSVQMMNEEIYKALHLEGTQDLDILDAGCGVGSFTTYVAARTPKNILHGVTITPLQAAIAREYQLANCLDNVRYVVGDYTLLPYPDNFFDVAVFCDSFCNSENPKDTLLEIKKKLKQGGVVLISDIFLFSDVLCEEDKNLFQELQKGWHVPNLCSINQMLSLLNSENGFYLELMQDLTVNVFPSARRAGLGAEVVLKQKIHPVQNVQGNRVAACSFYSLLKRNKMKYYWFIAKKMSS